MRTNARVISILAVVTLAMAFLPGNKGCLPAPMEVVEVPADAPVIDELTPLEAGLVTDDIAGNVRVFLTDNPGPFSAVWVTITEVRVNQGVEGAEGEWLTLVDSEQTLDLLQLQNDVTTIMDDADLAPGHYAQLRMIVSDAWVEFEDGTAEPLTIPSGSQSGIKINLHLTVEAGKTYALVLDFDAGESIHATGNGRYTMRPVIRMEYVGEVGPDGDVDEVTEPAANDPAGDPADEPAAGDPAGDGAGDPAGEPAAGDPAGDGSGDPASEPAAGDPAGDGSGDPAGEPAAGDPAGDGSGDPAGEPAAGDPAGDGSGDPAGEPAAGDPAGDGSGDPAGEPAAGDPAGDGSGDPAGEPAAGDPAGDGSGDPAGEPAAGDPAGDGSGDPAGEPAAGDPAGDGSGDPAGEPAAGDPAGDGSGDPAGEPAAGDPAGDGSGDPAGDGSGDPAGEPAAGDPAGGGAPGSGN